MASLLGGEYCIESLRQDVKDLQNTLSDVHSRVGQVKYQSWKFPDKASCDVDVTDVLDKCQFNRDDDEECQMSHVMLYDIVIDRLVYLLQSFISFNEILLDVDGCHPVGSPIISPKKSRGASVRSMSVGLTVKKCWSRMTQIATLLQRLAKEVDQGSIHLRTPESQGHMDKHNREQKASSPKIEDPMKSPKNKDISCDVRTVSCQTTETAYSTCETCCRAQNCLNDVGKTIIDVCKTQGLPTALEDYLARYKEDVPMSVADLMRWSKHQTKDLSRISRHMTSLTNLVTPLKSEIVDIKKREQSVRTELNQSQAVFERKEAEIKEEYRRREYQLKETEKSLKKKIATMENIQKGMKEELDTCQWKISDLKDELLQKHRDILNLENSIAQHKEEAIEGQQYKKDALKFKNELNKVKNEFENVEQQLLQHKQQFERERTRNENMSRHEQLLQEKQKNLLKRMETLDEDCEKMREQILLLEEERDNAHAQLEKAERHNKVEENATNHNQSMAEVQTREIEMLKQKLEAIRNDNQELQSAVDDYIERERILVVYPDLNKEKEPSPMVQGSGDVFTDMRRQVEANQIRIQVLQKENDTLLKTLEKIDKTDVNSISPSDQSSPVQSRNSMFRESPRNVFSKPVQLWKTSEIQFVQDTGRTEYEEDTAEAVWYQNHQNSRSPPSKSSGRHSRPTSGRHRTSVIAPNKTHKTRDVAENQGVRVGSGTSAYSSSSLEAYKKLKQQQQSLGIQNVRSSFTVGTGKRPKSGRPSSAKSALFKPWT